MACILEPHDQPNQMRIPFLRPALACLVFTTFSVQALDTWVLADGRMFEADVKQVTPGTVLFTLRTGVDQPLEITKLSERSRKQLVEVIGLGSTPVTPVAPIATAPAAPTPPPQAPMTAATPTPPPPPTVAPMASMARDPGALDATDTGSLEANFGLTATVIGKVKKVVTMGSSGHKLIEFEDTDFNIFINKRQLETPGWNFEGVEGKLVQAKGKIGKYNEKLQIQLYEPGQMGVVE